MKKHFLITILSVLILGTNYLAAQSCAGKQVADNSSYLKLKKGSGFSGSYALPCIQKDYQAEINVPFQTFTTIAHLNGEDTVYAMRIDKISNLPAGLCWATTSANNMFKPGEGGILQFSGVVIDNPGQYNLTMVMSFDTNGDGKFDRTDVNYNIISKTGKLILRVNTTGADCPSIDYTSPGVTASKETSGL
ncbi:MAG: hypothetical protein JNK66_00450 [Chitinophagales bacterium]|nr:hypothetical protein [Chitinophagales bacterium]